MPNLTIDQAMHMAAQHHQSGRLAQAEQIYRQVLAFQPDHANALHLLGVLAGQAGQPDVAIDLIGQAVRITPNFPEAYSNLGCALAQAGRFEEAISAFNWLIKLQPGNAPAYNALGCVLRSHGRLDDAANAFIKAIRLKPDFAEAHTNLGGVFRIQGRLDEAIAAHSRAVALRPDFAEAHSNMANALKEKGRIDEAIAAHSRVVELRNNSAEAHFNLAEALAHKGQLKEAVAAYRRALEINPAYLEANINLGKAQHESAQYTEAALCHRRALELSPDNVTALDGLGLALIHMNEVAAAGDNFRRALALAPDLASSWNGLGGVFRAQGQFDEAANCFRRALELSPDQAIFYTNLVSTGRQVIDTAEMQRLAEILKQPDLATDDRIAAGFAMGKLRDEADRFDEAFECFAEANRVVKEQFASLGQRFDIDVFRRQIDRTIETFAPQFFADRQGWGEDCELPVFIVGMPRSGTSLVEQIVASHPQVFGAGELGAVNSIPLAQSGADMKVEAPKWTSTLLKEAATAHVQRLQGLGGSATRVVDKMPDNVLELGLLGAMFPGSRVIFCHRDARDNCLSCYFQWFIAGQTFAYDLANCGKRYLEINRLSRHWLDVLPVKMLSVQYEEVVADLEGQSRRLIDFLGLPWDPACLDFHKSQRMVLTSSAWQVRQPIYSRSVGRWRHYERHLGPLFQVLNAHPETLANPSVRP